MPAANNHSEILFLGGRNCLLFSILALLAALVGSYREVSKLWGAPVLSPAAEVVFNKEARAEFLELKGFEADDKGFHLAPKEQRAKFLELKGFAAEEDGSHLAPQSAGLLIYALHIEPARSVAIEPLFTNAVGTKKFRNRLSYSIDGGKSYITAGENRSYFAGQAVMIPPAESPSLLLRFDAANTTDERVLVLQGFRWRNAEEAAPVPRLSRLFWGLAVGLLVYTFCGDWTQRAKLAMAAGVGASFVACVWASASPPLAVVLLGASVAKWLRSGTPRPIPFEVPALLLILALGAHLREAKLAEYAHSSLSGDAVGYRQIALEMKLFSWDQGFYAPRWREPGFPFAAKILFGVFGDSELHLRLFTVYAGLAAIALSWWVGRVMLHPFAGLLAALWMASENYLIFRSMYGYRLEVNTVWFLVLVYAIFAPPLLKLRNRTIMAGLAGGFLVLTELSMLPVAVLFLAWFVWTNRSSWKAAVVAPALLLLMLAPFCLRQAFQNGDPLYPLALHAQWYRNLETGKYRGYEGPTVSTMDYLFDPDLHPPGDLAKGTLDGYVKYLGGEPFFKDRVVRLLFLVGFFLALALPGHRVLAALVFLSNSPPALFLYGASILTEERVLLHAFPFAAHCAAIPLLWLFRNARINTQR